MKYFTDLFDTLLMIDENIETRAKAKEFKSSMKPIIKRVKDAEVGDPRRYAYMLAWPFMRDVLGIEEMQGQDCPVNSALIQRKLEELYDAGRLPEDAGKQFEQYANAEYENFVNMKSITRPKNKGEFVGFDETESASERAERNRIERELQAAKAKEAQEDPSYDIDVDVSEVDNEFKSVVSDIADSIGTRSSTSIVEIFFNPADGPIVQKQFVSSLFPQEELVSPAEIEADKFVFELKPNSKISKMIVQRGADSIEEYLTNLLTQRMDRDVRVVIHAPEEGGTYEEPLPDTAPAAAPEAENSMDKFGGVSYESVDASIAKLIPESHTPSGEFTIQAGKYTYEVAMRGGSVVSVSPVGDAPDINLNALRAKMSKGMKVKDALIASSNIRPRTAASGGVGSYIPESWRKEEGKYVKPFVETSRERFKPTRGSQIPLYRNW